jgi:hypothetical protein
MMGYKDNNTPMDTHIPEHMICKICGQCSTALNPERICWRHEEYKNGYDVTYYLGRVEGNEKKRLPLPVSGEQDG